MTIYALYATETNDVIGAVEADELPDAIPGGVYLEAPQGFTLDSNLGTWKYDGVSAIVKKTGSDFKAGFAPKKKQLIQKHFEDFDPIETTGDVEGAVDVAMQMLHHFANSTTPTQTEIDNWNAFYNTNKDYFRYVITSQLPQALWDAMATAKAAARSKEQDLKNDPEWEDPS